MPTYTFRHKETGEVVDKFLQISKRDKFIEDNPQLEQTCAYTSIPIGDPVRLGLKTTDNGFKAVLSKIHSQNGVRSTLGQKLSRSKNGIRNIWLWFGDNSNQTKRGIHG